MSGQADYDRALKQFPAAPEDFRKEWAEKVAHNPLLQALYFSGGPRSEWDYLDGRDPYPFEPADYPDGHR